MTMNEPTEPHRGKDLEQGGTGTACKKVPKGHENDGLKRG